MFRMTLTMALIVAMSAMTFAQTTQPAATQPAATQPKEEAKKELTADEKISYFAAYQFSQDVLRNGGKLNADELIKGINDAKKMDKDLIFAYITGLQIATVFEQQGIKLNEKQLRDAIADLKAGKPFKIQQQEIQMAMQEINNRKKLENEAAGKAYMDKLAKKEGVKKTESGLLYEVLATGKGEVAKADETISFLYTGTLIDGEEFDSSKKHGNVPLEFHMDRRNRLVPGMMEILATMKVGDKWRVTIPGPLAYDVQQGPGGPGSTLIFEIEVVSIKKSPPAPQPRAFPGGFPPRQ